MMVPIEQTSPPKAVPVVRKGKKKSKVPEAVTLDKVIERVDKLVIREEQSDYGFGHRYIIRFKLAEEIYEIFVESALPSKPTAGVGFLDTDILDTAGVSIMRLTPNKRKVGEVVTVDAFLERLESPVAKLKLRRLLEDLQNNVRLDDADIERANEALAISKTKSIRPVTIH